MSRAFVLRREADVSGVSGTGDVAEGVVFSDGTTVLRWNRAGGSTAVYDSLERMEAIHGHDGRTAVVFEAPEDRAEGLDVERLSEVDSIVSTLHDFRELLPEDRRAVFDKFAWRAHDILRPALAVRLTPDRTPTEEER